MANNLDQTGVMQVNGAWVTRVQYEAAVLGPTTGAVELRFMQGRAEVARASLSRGELGELLGERNAAAIERHVSSDADKYLPTVKGELRGTRLHYREVTIGPRDARDQENSIEVSRTRADTDMAKARINERDTGADQSKTEDEPKRRAVAKGDSPLKETTAQDPVPPHIASKYLVKDDTYYFDDQSVAFVDKGSRFTVQTHNKSVIQDLVEIAKARDWHEVTVTGAEAFRREAWKEAYAAGLAVKGYKPPPIELEAANRERLRRRRPNELAADSREREAPGAPVKGAVYGTLVAHDEAPYRHDATKSTNYYVTLRGEDGTERTLWGVGLADAIKQAKSAPTVGDQVGILRVGSTPVSVTSRAADANGEIVAQQIETKRNQWVIEKASYFKNHPDLQQDALARAPSNLSEKTTMATTPDVDSKSLSPTAMTRDQQVAAAIRSAATTREELQLKYPELNKAVFQHLQSHVQFAEAYVKAGLIRETDRAQVITQMRERLASQIERGAPIKEPDSRQVSTLIRRSVDRVAADIGRRPVEIGPRAVTEIATPKTLVRDEIQVRA
jgi:hypothetical protein